MDNANNGGTAKVPGAGQGNFAPNSQQGGLTGAEQGAGTSFGMEQSTGASSGVERNINRVNLEPIAKPDEIAPDLGNATLAMPDLMATPPEIEGQMPDVAEIMRQEKNRERAGEGMAMDILEFARSEEAREAESTQRRGEQGLEGLERARRVQEADLTTLADGGSTEGRKIVSLDGDVMDKESEKMVVKAYNELPLNNLHSWRHEQMRRALKANYNRDFGEERTA